MWYKTTQIAKRENLLLPLHVYSFQLAARDLLYAPSHRLDSTPQPLLYQLRTRLEKIFWCTWHNVLYQSICV